MSHNVFLVPSWFLGYDIIFQVLFVLVTLLVAWSSFKIYNLTQQARPKIFGMGFLLISTGYLMQAILNSIFFFHIQHIAFSPRQASFVINSYMVAVYSYTYIVLLGLITLVYMSFNVKKIKIHFLISLLVMMVLISSQDKLLLFYLMSVIICLFITHHYLSNYIKNKKTTSLLVMLGFTAMLASYVLFVFSLDSEIFYFAGHAVKLGAYILILTNLIRVLRADKKQKKK